MTVPEIRGLECDDVELRLFIPFLKIIEIVLAIHFINKINFRGNFFFKFHVDSTSSYVDKGGQN